MEQRKNTYHRVHVTAKVIVFLINTALLYIVYLLNDRQLTLYLLAFYNATYFFGVNTVSYLIERVLHLKHLHDIV